MVWEAAYDALSAGIHADIRNIEIDPDPNAQTITLATLPGLTRRV